MCVLTGSLPIPVSPSPYPSEQLRDSPFQLAASKPPRWRPAQPQEAASDSPSVSLSRRRTSGSLPGTLLYSYDWCWCFPACALPPELISLDGFSHCGWLHDASNKVYTPAMVLIAADLGQAPNLMTSFQLVLPTYCVKKSQTGSLTIPI